MKLCFLNRCSPSIKYSTIINSFLLIVVISGCGGGARFTPDENGDSRQLNIRNSLKNSSAYVFIGDSPPQGLVLNNENSLCVYGAPGVSYYRGSGSFVSNDGLVLTCAHLFNNLNINKNNFTISIVARNDSGSFEIMSGKIYSVSKTDDLALISTSKIRKNFLEISDVEPLVNDNIYFMGASSGPRRGVFNGYLLTLYHIGSDTLKGDSGSAIINDEMKIISVVSEGDYNNSLYFHIPIPSRGVPLSAIKKFLTKQQ